MCYIYVIYDLFVCISCKECFFIKKQVSPALGLPMWVLYFLQGVMFALSEYVF